MRASGLEPTSQQASLRERRAAKDPLHKENAAMRNLTLRQIYLYLVSFVALMLLVTGLIRSVMAVADFFMPNGYYIPGPAEVYARFRGPDGKDTVPKEVIEQQTEFEQERAKAQRNAGAYNELKRGLAYVVVALPVWLYHWRKVQFDSRGQGSQAIPTGEVPPSGSSS